MAEQQTAKLAGIYRCTGMHRETRVCEVGDTLPECDCEGGGYWEFLKEDNLRPDVAAQIFVGRGIIHSIVTDEPIKLGDCLNIRQAAGNGLRTGLHTVVKVEDDFQFDGKNNIRIFVKRIDDFFSDSLPIHQAIQMNC